MRRTLTQPHNLQLPAGLSRKRWAVVACVASGLVACGTDLAAGGVAAEKPKDAGGSPSLGFDVAFAIDAAGDAVADSAAPADGGEEAFADAAVAVPDTATADQGVAADAVALGCPATCAIDDDCSPAADPCTAAACKMGCCQPVPTVGNLCDDGVPCNGPDACKGGICTPALPDGCDDGLGCTTDSCDGEKCHHAVMADWCQIGTSCVQDGIAAPGNPCKICDAGADQDGWSILAGCCKQDDDCPTPGPCDIAVCDTAAGKCHVKKAKGCCKSSADCDDGDACTTDACDTTSGDCASAAVVCKSPTECQTAACDAGTGACKLELLTNWCFLEGACVSAGSANSGNACQVCVPAISPNAWSADPGTSCNDGNACSFSDICTASGECKGTLQPGCCASDADCAGQGSGCKVGTCNKSVGLCALVDKPGCCMGGVCCDTVNSAVLPAGTACGSSTLGAQYKCAGPDMQMAELSPGCNGLSGTVCSTALDTAAIGPWSTLQTCPAGTTCTEKGSGIPPSCEVVGTCGGSCGGAGASGCKCGADCVASGLCCPDAKVVCGCTGGACCDASAGMVLANGTPCGAADAVVQFQCQGLALQKRTGQGKCTGSPSCSTLASDVFWGGWQTVQLCSSACNAAADGSSASCGASQGSCNGRCGTVSTTGLCSCTPDCLASGTCCADYFAKHCDMPQGCGAPPLSCVNFGCGAGNSAACWCDAACNTIGDCCPDKFLCGCP